MRLYRKVYHTVLGTSIVSRYILLPLGGVTLLVLCWNWSRLNARTGWVTVGVSVLEIMVPLLTWTASQQFMRWFID